METDDDARGVPLGDGDGAALLAEFGGWLDRERGLSPVSVWSVPDLIDTGLGCQVGEFPES